MSNSSARDKGSPLKARKSVEQKNSGQHSANCGTNSAKNYHKPWPSRKATGDEELVRYMSSVPGYLQHVKSEDKAQENALNVGVLDWGLLEKWAYNQKIATATGRGRVSPSTSNASSSFPTFSPSSQSSRSMSSPLSRRRQSISDQSARSCPSHLMEEEETHKDVTRLSDSRSSSPNMRVGHNRHLLTRTEDLAKQHPKDKLVDSGSKTVSGSASKASGLSTSDSTSKDHDILVSVSPPNAVKVQDGRSEEVENSARYHEPQHCRSLGLAIDGHRDQHAAVSEKIGGMRSRLQERGHMRGMSFESTMFNVEETKQANRNSYSGAEGIRSTNLSFYGSHSGPLRSSNQNDENRVASSSLFENAASATKSSVKHEGRNKFSGISSELFKVLTAEESAQDEVKATGAANVREISLEHQSSTGLPWIGRSSSLRAGSPLKQRKLNVSSDSLHVDKVNPNNKGRRSPLRRLLDPLVKTKNRNITFGTPTGSATNDDREQIDGFKSPLRNLAHESCKPADTDKQAKGRLNSSNQVVPTVTSSPPLEEGHAVSSRQALLQLVWKNGLPLFMFSSNDNDILAAMVKRRRVSSKDDFECVYTIFSVQEVKKKTGIWINQASKSKKHGLVSNVIGQIKVSQRELIDHNTKSHVLTREFVLFGSEDAQTLDEPVDSMFDKELAAIIAKLPECYVNSDLVGSLQTERDTLTLPNILAILPSGVHGSSAAGEPTPLIERWKSGGLCDCGGWDEGCSLTVLNDNMPSNKNFASNQACPNVDGSHQFELFAQGGSLKNKYTFSMVGFREGLYTIDFGESIALVQAFALCISILHNRIPRHHLKEPSSEVDDPRGLATPVRQGSIVRTHCQDPARCVPNHPPVSPDGRA